VIGAAALVDAGNTWWAARTNVDVIPFGEQEGVGLSDPSRLTEWANWSVTQLVHRYVAVLVVCLLALALVYAWGLRQARRELAEFQAS
jgi:heme A synthase